MLHEPASHATTTQAFMALRELLTLCLQGRRDEALALLDNHNQQAQGQGQGQAQGQGQMDRSNVDLSRRFPGQS